MRKRWNRHIPILLTGVLTLLVPMNVSAESSANYCFGSGATTYKSAPVAYEVEKVYHARDFEGMDDLNNLASMFVTDDSVYISTEKAVLVLDYNFNVKHILSEYTALDGTSASIKNPDGLFVTDEGLLYVCEPGGGHILVFDRDYNLVASHEKPEGLDLEIGYQPDRIVVDSLDRMYVIASGVYEGILEISRDNQFQRYFGTTTVKVSPIEIFFRSIASEAQLSRQALILPTEYSSMTVDSKGFIYTTIQSSNVENPVRLLNVNGTDIMPEDWQGNPPVGDQMFAASGQYSGESTLTDVDCNDYGMYMVLDAQQNRIFTYDSASNVLFVFGGRGDKDGCFLNPVSIRWMGESNRVIVADKLAHSITVMKPTNYAKAIFEAVKYEALGDRQGAVPYWQQALDMNYNCNVAKDALGRMLYWNGEYEEAQEILGSITRTDYYSMAFEKNRERLIRAYAPGVVLGLLVLLAAFILFRRFRRTRKGGSEYAG